MNKFTKVSIFLLRLAQGWFFFYAGITKVLDPTWSAVGYLGSAKTFPGFFNWFASTQNIGWINFVNEWGLTLVGISLVFGIFVRWASLVGILLMILYYLPAIQFPFIPPHAFLVDEHIIYLLVFVFLYSAQAGRLWGLDGLFHKRRA